MNACKWAKFLADVRARMRNVINNCEQELLCGGMTLEQQMALTTIKQNAVTACDTCKQERGRILVKEEMKKLQQEGWGFVCWQDEQGLYHVEAMTPEGKEHVATAVDLVEAFETAKADARG